MKPNNGMTDIGIPQKLNDRIGSLAAPYHRTSPMAANGRIPVDRQRYFESQNLNVCFHRKRSFKLLENC